MCCLVRPRTGLLGTALCPKPTVAKKTETAWAASPPILARTGRYGAETTWQRSHFSPSPASWAGPAASGAMQDARHRGSAAVCISRAEFGGDGDPWRETAQGWPPDRSLPGPEHNPAPGTPRGSQVCPGARCRLGHPIPGNFTNPGCTPGAGVYPGCFPDPGCTPGTGAYFGPGCTYTRIPGVSGTRVLAGPGCARKPGVQGCRVCLSLAERRRSAVKPSKESPQAADRCGESRGAPHRRPIANLRLP